MNLDPKEMQEKLRDLGIRGVLIITRNGMPLLVRSFVKEGDQIFGKDPALFSGFLAGLGRFADDQIQGLLSDIGLHTVRLFFDYTEEMIFLLAFDEIKLTVLPGYEVRTLVKGTMAEIKSALQDYFADVDKSIEEIVKDPKLFEHHRDSLNAIGEVLERILYKSHLEILKLIESGS